MRNTYTGTIYSSPSSACRWTKARVSLRCQTDKSVKHGINTLLRILNFQYMIHAYDPPLKDCKERITGLCNPQIFKKKSSTALFSLMYMLRGYKTSLNNQINEYL